jgi:hypothetical protein
MTLRRRQFALAVYVAIALVGCGIYYLLDTTPWIVGKILAISSPALLAAALAGGALLRSRRPAGILVVLAIGGGVVCSNVLAYHDATLAPRPRLAELQHLGDLVAGKGPTLVNEYEWYADRHFLRSGDPVGSAEYRPYTVPLRDGAILTASAEADLDAFAVTTLEGYRSIVTRRSPAESRPPSIYRLVWQGRYYQLWQRPTHPSTSILEHVPFGESNTLPYCGSAQNRSNEPLCSIDPVATPPCAQIQGLARQALAEHAELLAYQRAEPIVARGDETVWPARWIHNLASHTLLTTTPGRVVAHIAVASGQSYELWLRGSFVRGFDVTVDGRHVGRVKNELSMFSGYVNFADFGGYVHLTDLFLAPGIHTFVLTYPHADLTPGSADNEQLTSLNAITLEPQSPSSELIGVTPGQAARLCGRPLDWIELVRTSS